MIKIRLTYEKLMSWLQTYYLVLAVVVFIIGLKRFASIPKTLVLNEKVFFGASLNIEFRSFAVLITILLIVIAVICSQHLTTNLWKILVTFLLFLFEHLFNSIGAKTHLFQFWLWSSVPLAIMPSLAKLHFHQRFWHVLGAVWASLSITLLFYFFSGFWKLCGIISQLSHGEDHLLSTNGLVAHMYSEVLRANAHPLFMDFLLSHRYLNPILASCVILIQLSCIFGVVWGRSHKYLAYGLLSFHLGTFFILDITYPTNFFLVAVLLLPSPIKYRMVSAKHLKKIFVRS